MVKMFVQKTNYEGCTGNSEIKEGHGEKNKERREGKVRRGRK